MYFSQVLVLAFAAVAICAPAEDDRSGSHQMPPWHPPRGDDRRSPCPMLNTLANHGFIRHSGKNISISELVDGLDAGLNLSPDSSQPIAELAATTSTTGNPTTLNLDDLAKAHGVIEHDASLSRNDVFFGDNNSFNPAIFAGVARSFRGPVIDVETAAKARVKRVRQAIRANPQITFGDNEDGFSKIETALYLRVFGGVQGNAKTSWVKTMFEEERLPYNLGYRRPRVPIMNQEILDLGQAVGDAAQV